MYCPNGWTGLKETNPTFLKRYKSTSDVEGSIPSAGGWDRAIDVNPNIKLKWIYGVFTNKELELSSRIEFHI